MEDLIKKIRKRKQKKNDDVMMASSSSSSGRNVRTLHLHAFFSSHFDSGRFIASNEAPFVPMQSLRPPLSIPPKALSKIASRTANFLAGAPLVRRRSSSFPVSTVLVSPDELHHQLPMPYRISSSTISNFWCSESTKRSSVGRSPMRPCLRPRVVVVPGCKL